MKGELSGETMAEFATFRSKTYSYLTDVNDGNKKAKHKKVCNKKKMKIIKIVQRQQNLKMK